MVKWYILQFCTLLNLHLITAHLTVIIYIYSFKILRKNVTQFLICDAFLKIELPQYI